MTMKMATCPILVLGIILSMPRLSDAYVNSNSLKEMIQACEEYESTSRHLDKQGNITVQGKDGISDLMNAHECAGFLSAVMQFTYFTEDDGKRSEGICMPDGTGVKDAISLFVTYARSHRKELEPLERLSELPAMVAIWALKEAYPCKP